MVGGTQQIVGFTVEGAFGPRLETLVGVVITQETTGGARLRCEDVTRPDFDLAGACYNVLTSRVIPIFQTSDTYSFVFGRFTSGQDVLLLIYGFEDDRPTDSPAGVSCTPHRTGAPGSGQAVVVGNPMRPL